MEYQHDVNDASEVSDVETSVSEVNIDEHYIFDVETSIKLSQDQKVHVAHIADILSVNHFVIDNTIMGMGKTYMHRFLAESLGLKLLVFGSNDSLNSWQLLDQTNGKYTYESYTYAGLSGAGRDQPKHGYLTVGHTEGKIFYKATKKLIDLINKGVYIVFDEAHNLKNDTNQGAAARAIANTIIRSDETQSRFALLTASPVTSETGADHITRYLHIGHIIKDKVLARWIRKEQQLEYLGLGELIEFCKKTMPDQWNEFIENHEEPSGKEKGPINEFVMQVYEELIMPFCVVSMDVPILDAKINCSNGFYTVCEEAKKKMEDTIAALKSKVGYDEETGQSKKVRASYITDELMMFEKICLEVFERLTKLILVHDPEAQVIISLNFKENIDDLVARLQEFNPSVISGKIKDRRKRLQLVQDFQDSKTRLLIGTIYTIGASYSLHDKKGGKCRYMLCSPNHRIDLMHQAAGRIYRYEVASDCVFRAVYAEGCEIVSRILNNLSNKTKIMKRTLPKQAEARLFPGEYESVNITGNGADDDNEILMN